MLLIALTVALLAATPGMAQDKLAKGEVQKIAEEAFIYGFPMVMNYGIMYEYFIDKSSAQYKAPFNQIYNTAQRLHAEGHGRRHAQQRHAVLLRLRWTCGPSRSC